MPFVLIPQSHLPLRKRFIKEQTSFGLLEANSDPQSNGLEKTRAEDTTPAEDKTKCSSKVNTGALPENIC